LRQKSGYAFLKKWNFFPLLLEGRKNVFKENESKPWKASRVFVVGVRVIFGQLGQFSRSALQLATWIFVS
jgi:hypothetical protein